MAPNPENSTRGRSARLLAVRWPSSCACIVLAVALVTPGGATAAAAQPAIPDSVWITAVFTPDLTPRFGSDLAPGFSPAGAGRALRFPVVHTADTIIDTVAGPVTRPGAIARHLPPRSTSRNVAFLLGTGAVAFGVTWVLPEDMSKWDKSRSMSYYLRRSYTEPPVWDKDPFVWNWVIHPVMGKYAYLMERNHGRSPLRGFLLSTAASVGWEYGFEAFIERPSIQDLLITSPAGSILGEMSYQLTRRMQRDGFNMGEKIVVTIVNPVHVVQYGYKE